MNDGSKSQQGNEHSQKDVTVLAKSRPPERMREGKIECNACPVLCKIAGGATGACDRWGNVNGDLIRIDPVLLMERAKASGTAIVPFAEGDGLSGARSYFVTGVGAGTTYPDYKPAPFIVGSRQDDVDMVTVVTEGIFSYCSFKVKVDTDRYLGHEAAPIRYAGEHVGHVATAEYGSQMLNLGGVHHLTGGSKPEGRATVKMMMELGNKQPVDLEIEGGAKITVEAGKPPIVNGVPEQRMRVGCGSATIGIFAKQWWGLVDEVVVLDDHITGVLTEHQAGKCLDMPPSGIKMGGRRSTPGRYFQIANPGAGWGGTDLTDPLKCLVGFDPKVARPGLRLLITSTTGEDAAYFELDEALQPVAKPMPPALTRVIDRIAENCEPSLATVLFVGGAGGSLRAGATENPVALTRSIKDRLVNVTCGGVPCYVWPGGGITVMVDVAQMPNNSFGYVPTPAIVAPIEFTLRLDDYRALGGHMDAIVSVDDLLREPHHQLAAWEGDKPWPLLPTKAPQ